MTPGHPPKSGVGALSQPTILSDRACATYREAGLWGDRLIVDYVDANARRTPEKAAIIDSRETIAYAELARRSQNLAAALLALGVGPGDAVAVRAPNWAELPISHLAANRVGAIFLPLSTGFGETEILHLLATSQARVFVSPVDDAFGVREFLHRRRSQLPHLRHVICLRAPPAQGELSFDVLANDEAWRDRRAEDELARARSHADAPSHVMVSSGTTGLPKCSLFSDNNTIVKVLLQYCGSVAKVTSDDVAAAIAPAGTGSTGYNYPILAALLVGATSVMLEHWRSGHAEEALRLIEAHGCTYAVVVPTQLSKLIAVPNLHEFDFSRLRLITNSGAKLPAPVAEGAERLFGAVVQSVYGCSEAGAATMTSVTDTRERRLRTAGRPLVGQEVVIRGDDGAVLGPDHVGEVCWRGANKSYGFLNDPESTNIVWDDEGWISSGDLGVIDSEGYLTIVGRKKDMIIRGGQNINPRAIEEVLLRHESVVDVAIAAVPDPVLGERVGAFVVPRRSAAPPSLEELSSFVARQGLAKWNQPEVLVILEDLPRNAGGKIDKRRLIEMHRPTVASRHQVGAA
jgi:acyl-CoA synthetase (AMP-forming)/AMP-acid ligase II